MEAAYLEAEFSDLPHPEPMDLDNDNGDQVSEVSMQMSFEEVSMSITEVNDSRQVFNNHIKFEGLNLEAEVLADNEEFSDFEED